MNAGNTPDSKEIDNQAPNEVKDTSFRDSFTSNASTTASFYCETAAQIERRAHGTDPLSVEAWANKSDEFEAPVSDSSLKFTTRVDRSASFNAAEHVSLSPSNLAPLKKTDARKVTPPNPSLSSSPEQLETGPWSPANPPPTPRVSRTRNTPRVQRSGTNF